ncbi:MAG: ABC transporter ATP-binding protein [Planctomycetota bacterium]|nr:ABC transporter ATP-binding protein [Planctomycetota bacterium]
MSMIETRNLTKRYDNNFVALRNLNLTCEAGEVFGYIGPNGAGKTTTIRILCGLLLPSDGTALVDGIDVARNPGAIRRITGYMPDAFGVYEEMRVWEYLDFFGACFKIPRRQRKKRIDEVLAITRSEAMRDYFVDTLSRGMRQRIGIAKTLMHDPKVLFLDEPANGLDPRARIDMRALIRDLAALGKTVLVSSHILPELASICDRVGIIERGVMLAQGTVEEIMRKVQPNRLVNMQFLGDSQTVLALAQGLERAGYIQKPEIMGDILQFEVGGRDEEIAKILRFFIAKKVNVVWFREEQADLEKAFLKVTDGAAAAGARAVAEAEEA